MATMDTDPPSSSSRNDTAAAGPPPDDSSQNAMAASQNDRMAADTSSAGSQTAVNDGASLHRLAAAMNLVPIVPARTAAIQPPQAVRAIRTTAPPIPVTPAAMPPAHQTLPTVAPQSLPTAAQMIVRAPPLAVRLQTAIRTSSTRRPPTSLTRFPAWFPM